MDKSYKMEGVYHEQRRTTWFLWKEGATPSVVCSWWKESTFRQHYVQLGTELQKWR